MSHDRQLPKCGAAARTYIPFYSDWSCGSDYRPFGFHQSEQCRIAELERENARLRAEQYWALRELAALATLCHKSVHVGPFSVMASPRSPDLHRPWVIMGETPRRYFGTLLEAALAAWEKAKQDGSDHAIDGK